MRKPDVDVSIILTAHREGVLSGATARSALVAVERAKAKANLACEFVVVLDNSDDLTERTLREALVGTRVNFLHTTTGDPGCARNAGVVRAEGRISTFLDADDLWSENWIVEGVERISNRPDAVFHSACNVMFGDVHNLWWHIDSEGLFFDPVYLEWGNYWDSMSMALTEIYRLYPFEPNDLKLGYGHEDWHWNALTIAAGVPHKPVLNTAHFKRRRPGSQMALVDKAGGVRRPLSA